ncbi:MAG: TolC family protein [Prevotellaceae bacterium]|jgi:outer membrane protein TolC|nr:TolC family protein [Prevotellaceae bacterium]
MKSFLRTKKILLLMLGFTLSANIQAQDSLRINNSGALKITLQQAIEIAQNENPTIRIADKEIELKKVANQEVYANLYPQASAVGTYSRTIKKQTMVMEFGGASQRIQVGSDNSYSGGIQINLPLFAPALYQTINLTKADIELASEKAHASKLDLVNQVVKAYYQLLLAQDSYDVLEKSYKNAEENYKNIDARYQQGLVSEYDKIRAEVQMRSIKPSVVSAANGIRLAMLQLKVLMGIDPTTEIAVEGNLKDHESGMFSRQIHASSMNLEQNSDMKQLDLTSEMLRRQLKVQRTSYLPTLSATFGYMYTSLNNDFKVFHYNWFPYSTLGLNLNIPLFNATTSKKTKQIKIQIEQMQDVRINTERQLNMLVQSYLDNMSANVEQVISNKESINQAQKGRTIAVKRYEVGAGTILEINDSEIALTQAELVYNQSIYNYLTAKADLYKTLGRDTIVE